MWHQHHVHDHPRRRDDVLDDCLVAVGEVPSGRTRRTVCRSTGDPAQQGTPDPHRIEPAIEQPAVVGRDLNPRPVTLAAAEALLRQVIDRFGGLTLDIEHTGYPIGHPQHRLKTVQLGDDLPSWCSTRPTRRIVMSSAHCWLRRPRCTRTRRRPT